MLRFSISVNGMSQSFNRVLDALRIYKNVESDPKLSSGKHTMRRDLSEEHLSKLFDCSQDTALFIKHEMYYVIDWLEQHPKQDPPQYLFDGLHDAGYISDEDYAKLEPKPNFVPRCPVCGSPDLKTISGLQRAASFGAFGFASSTARAQRQCKNCGYKF